MPETTTVATSASKKATEKAIAAVAAASDTLPTVVETAEVALEIPSKIVLNQKLVVVASVAIGTALGAGALYGVNKWRNRNKTIVAVDKPENDEYTAG